MKIPARKGPDVGKDHTELSDESLAWWAENARVPELKQACVQEQARRKNGQAAKRPEAEGIAPGDKALVITGTFKDAVRATEMLQRAAKTAHLVAPAPMCATLPDGCEVALAAVLVDPAETYPITGDDEAKPDDQLGLGKVALDKIAAALAISWDASLSCRLDDGSDPYYCHFRSVGYVRNFDTSCRTIVGQKQLDVRDGSPEIEKIVERERRKAERYKQKGWEYKGDYGRSQIRDLRIHILSRTETGARLRAIRSLGIRTSYKRIELQKPFVCARTVFTGCSDDPIARAEHRAAIRDSFLGAANRSYGPAPVAAAPPASEPHRPPSHYVHDPDDDYIETTGQPVREAKADPKPDPKPAEGNPDQRPNDEQQDGLFRPPQEPPY